MAYLTNDEYVERFGNAETVRITDESKTGAIDATKVSDAIDDASDLADSYLGARYQLPLAAPYPEILQGIVAALARELLHRQRPSQAVTDQANLARSQLKDLAAGRAVIPVSPGGTAPTEQNTAGAQQSGDARRRVFTDRSLCGFADLRSPYGGTVFNSGPDNW